MLDKLEIGYRKAVLKFEKPGVKSGSITPSISRTSSVNSTPSPCPTLSRVSLENSKCTETVSEGTSQKLKTKRVKTKKN